MKVLEWSLLKQWPVECPLSHLLGPCGPRDIITDDKNGLLVDNGDIEGLAEKICYLIENEDIRQKMGQQAHTDVQRFKIEHIALQWKELFDSLPEK